LRTKGERLDDDVNAEDPRPKRKKIMPENFI
jgi:hypothetical protein